MDITAFHAEQRSWGEDRECRPKILFDYEPPRDRNVGNPRYIVGMMLHAGRIVLDPDNRPVLDYPEIPLAVSSRFEDWRMEAIRRQNPRITPNDFRARMPRDPSGRNGRDISGNWRAAMGKDSLTTAPALVMRMTRWRSKHRCISWDMKAGSQAFRDHLWSLMTPYQKVNNTTEGMTDVLDLHEIEAMQAPNKGKFASRKRKRPAPKLAEGDHGEPKADKTDTTGERKPKRTRTNIDMLLPETLAERKSPQPKSEGSEISFPRITFPQTRLAELAYKSYQNLGDWQSDTLEDNSGHQVQGMYQSFDQNLKGVPSLDAPDFGLLASWSDGEYNSFRNQLMDGFNWTPGKEMEGLQRVHQSNEAQVDGV